MATDLRESWWGRHFEKIVLAAAALALVVSAVLWVALRPSRGGERDTVRRLIAEIRQRDEDTLEKVLPADERERLGLTREPMMVQEFKDRLSQLPAGWPADRDFIPRPSKVEQEQGPGPVKRTPPAQVLAVEDVQTAVGRGVTSEKVPHPLEQMTGYDLMDVAWVGCTGNFNLTSQVQQCADGNARTQPIVMTRVELSRRELKPDATWSDWELVPVQGAKAVLDKLPRRPDNSRDQRSVGLWIAGLDAMQQQVRRLPLVDLVASDPEGKTIAEIAGEVKGVEQATWPATPSFTAPTAPALEGPLPPAAPGPTPAAEGPWWRTVTPPSPTAPTAPEAELPMVPEFVYATVWANDFSVRPGRTYQYRMRVWVMNPVYGEAECPIEDARWTLDLAGEWSQPTEPVTIPRLVHFYFVGTFGEQVNLELHRWVHGQWVIMRSVKCRVGAPVLYSRRMPLKVPGTTKTVDESVDLSPGVLLVDLVRSFPYAPPGLRTIPTSVLIYADAQGTLGQRIDWEDEKEAVRARQNREQVAPTTAPKRGG